MSTEEENGEKLPVHEELQVVDYHTIRKSSVWWSAIVLFHDKYRRKNRIGLYLWHRENSKWKRKHKYVINSEEEFKKIINIVKFWLSQL